jgi:hypothetical protein
LRCAKFIVDVNVPSAGRFNREGSGEEASFMISIRRCVSMKRAEAIANAILEKMRQFNKWTDQTAFVQEGWDAMKQEIAKHESEYTQEKCSWVAKEWVKMIATMTPK